VRILLVEDRSDVADPVLHLMRRRGHEVEWAKNGMEAEDKMDQGWDLVVTDWDLGWGPNGAKVARRAVASNVPKVILWSGLNRERELLAQAPELLDDDDFHLLGKEQTRELFDLLEGMNGL
jgi:DNA-binding response OmpR family regulator